MKRESDALIDNDLVGALPRDQAHVDSFANVDQKQGALLEQHHQLLEGRQSDDSQLVDKACAFVVDARKLGEMLEDPQRRQYWQRILDYWAIFAYREALVEIDSDLLPFDPEKAPSLDDDQFPYRFEANVVGPAQQMLGWRRLLDLCQEDLIGDQLLTVVGDEGSGVELLVHNLVLPMLREGSARRQELKSSDQWRYYTITLGEEPVRDLLRAIARQDGYDDHWVTQCADELRKDPAVLVRILDADSERPALLVFERFSRLLSSSSNDRTTITEALANLLENQQPRYYMIATLSRNQLTKLSRFGRLEKPLRDGHVLLAFTTGELRHLIEEPAKRVGLIIERQVIDHILIDIQGEPTALSLLQFTLRRLWGRRERNRITWSTYERTGAGGTALSNAMDEVYNPLTEEQKSTLRNVLPAMVKMEPSGSFTTCEALREKLYQIGGGPSQVDEVLEILQREELIHQTSRDNEPVSVTITHQALLTSWQPLIDRLDELRPKEWSHLQLKKDATEWKDGGTPDYKLWRGADIEKAYREFKLDPSLTARERDFLDASWNREKRSKRWRKIVIVSLAFCVFLIVAGAAVFNIRIARNEKEIAQKNSEIARQETEIARQETEIARQEWEIAQKETRERNAKIGERMWRDTVEGLSSGDLPAALLWLDARREFVGSSNDTVERRIREIASLQLPRLRHVKFANTSGNDDNWFQDLAISPDAKHVAVIHRQRHESRNNENQTEDSIQLKVFSLDDSEQTPSYLRDDQRQLWRVSPRGVAAVAFASLSSAADESAPSFLLVAADRQLYAWKANGQTPKEWQPVTIQDNPIATSEPLVSIVTGGDGLVLTITIIQDEGNRQRLRLWRLVEQQGGGGIELHPVAAPNGNGEDNGRVDNKLAENVSMAQLSNQGYLLAVCKTDTANEFELKVWKKESQPEQWTPIAPPDWARSLDRQRGYDWKWSTTTEEGGGWKRRGAEIHAACFSPSGNQFVTACEDGQVLMWSITESSDSRRFVAPQIESELQLGSSVRDVAFLTEGVIITAGRSRTARIWDIHAAAEVAPRTYHEGTINKVAYGAGTLVTSTRRVLRIWDSDEYKQLESPCANQKVILSGDGRRVLYVNSDSDASSCPSSADLESAVIVIENANVHSAAISRDGQRVFVAHGEPISMDIRSWPSVNESLYRLKVPKSFAEDNPPLKDNQPLVEFSHSGNVVVAAKTKARAKNDQAESLFLWDLNSAVRDDLKYRKLRIPDHPAELTLRDMAFGRFGNHDLLAIVGEERKDDGGGAQSVIFFGVVDVNSQNDNQADLVRLEIHPDRSLPNERSVRCVAFSKSGDLLATGDDHDRAIVWNVAELIEKVQQASEGNQRKGSVIQADRVEVLKHSTSVIELCFSPDENNRSKRILATVSSEGEASVWSVDVNVGDAKESEVRTTPEFKLQHDAKILTVSFSPEGQWIITGGKDRTARIWHSVEGDLVGIFRHQGTVVQARLPQEDQILTVSRSSRVPASDQWNSPPLHIRHWTVSALEKEQLSEENLKSLAAREVKKDNMRLDMRLDRLLADELRALETK